MDLNVNSKNVVIRRLEYQVGDIVMVNLGEINKDQKTYRLGKKRPGLVVGYIPSTKCLQIVPVRTAWDKIKEQNIPFDKVVTVEFYGMIYRNNEIFDRDVIFQISQVQTVSIENVYKFTHAGIPSYSIVAVSTQITKAICDGLCNMLRLGQGLATSGLTLEANDSRLDTGSDTNPIVEDVAEDTVDDGTEEVLSEADILPGKKPTTTKEKKLFVWYRDNHTTEETADLYAISVSTAKRWYDKFLYEIYPEKYKNTHRRYKKGRMSRDEKLEFLKFCEANTNKRVMEEYGITGSTIYEWIRTFQSDLGMTIINIGDGSRYGRDITKNNKKEVASYSSPDGDMVYKTTSSFHTYSPTMNV